MKATNLMDVVPMIVRKLHVPDFCHRRAYSKLAYDKMCIAAILLAPCAHYGDACVRRRYLQNSKERAPLWTIATPNSVHC